MSATSHLPDVGFIGLGDQGAPIAQAIAEAGYPLHAWARRPESLETLGGVPYTSHASVAELAAISDVVGLCLVKDSDNVEVAVEGGLLANMRRGTVLINHGTGLPREARRLTELAAPYGISVVDAPVSGGHTVALAHQLTTIAGGPKDVVDELIPLLETFSKTVIYTGPTGAGQLGKLFNNALLMMNHENLSELLDLAHALDMPLAPLLDLLRSGSAASFALHAIGPSITSANVQHVRDLELKDMHLFTGAVESIRDPADPGRQTSDSRSAGTPGTHRPHRILKERHDRTDARWWNLHHGGGPDGDIDGLRRRLVASRHPSCPPGPP